MHRRVGRAAGRRRTRQQSGEQRLARGCEDALLSPDYNAQDAAGEPRSSHTYLPPCVGPALHPVGTRGWSDTQDTSCQLLTTSTGSRLSISIRPLVPVVLQGTQGRSRSRRRRHRGRRARGPAPGDVAPW